MSIPDQNKNIKSESQKILNIDNSANVETYSYIDDGQVEQGEVFKKYFGIIVIILVAALSFGLGRLVSTNSNKNVSINFDPSSFSPYGNNISLGANVINSTAASSTPGVQNNNLVYASSNGKRYYYSWCKSTISEKNKVTFSSKEMAEKAGYTLALNCKAR